LIERFYNKLGLYSATCSFSVPQLSARPLGAIAIKENNKEGVQAK